MENISELLKPELLILIPTCWGLGFMLKAVRCINNQLIPLVLWICACGLAALWIISTQCEAGLASKVFAAITQGTVSWLVAWLSYDLWIKDLGE